LIILVIMVILVLVAIVLVIIGGPSESKEVKISIDKEDYKIEDALKVNIENNLDEKICFSSCYPYYIEEKDGEEWKSIPYSSCTADNLVEKCINSKETKTFESILPSIEAGVYRLAISVCTQCNIGETFKEEQWFYSDEFIIK